MIEASVPEQADGGYWYVLRAVTDPDTGALGPGPVPGLGWAGTYGNVDGVDYAVIRCPEPVSGLESLPVTGVLAAAGYLTRPRSRIRGN